MITDYKRDINKDEINQILSFSDDKYADIIIHLLTVVLDHPILDLNAIFHISKGSSIFFYASYPARRFAIVRALSMSHLPDFNKNEIIKDIRRVFEDLYGIRVSIFDELTRGHNYNWTIEFSKSPRYLDYKIPHTGINYNDLSKDNKITISSNTMDYMIPSSLIEERTRGMMKKFIKPDRFLPGKVINLTQYPDEVVRIFIDFLTIGTIGMIKKYQNHIDLILDADLFALSHYLEEPDFTNTLMTILQNFMIETYSDDPSSDDARDFRAQLRQFKEYVPVIPMINHFIKQFMSLARYIDQNYKENFDLYFMEIDVERKTIKATIRPDEDSKVKIDLYEDLLKLGYSPIHIRPRVIVKSHR